MMGLVELFVLLAAVSGSAFIVAMFAWLWYRTKRLEERGVAQGRGPDHLLSEIEDVKAQLKGAEQEILRLEERVDFVEKLLDRGSGGQPSTHEPGSSEGSKEVATGDD